MDFTKINELSKKYEPQMTKFLRDMIAIPSESCQEEGVVRRIKKEMEDVGFDRVEFDKMPKPSAAGALPTRKAAWPRWSTPAKS